MYELVSKLVFYNNPGTAIYKIAEIIRYSEDDDELNYRINRQISKIIETAEKYQFSGNIWEKYIIYTMLADENTFTLKAERREEIHGTIKQVTLNDIRVIRQLIQYDISQISDNRQTMELIKNYKPAGQNMTRTARILNETINSITENMDTESVYDLLAEFYHRYGAGKYALGRAFKLDTCGDELIIPVSSFDDKFRLDDIHGYETQKQALIENTEAFVNNRKANNVLLYGDAGTGKSSSIKAVLNRYWHRGLRIIEVYKHDAGYLPVIISQIKDRNYRFILYMDDLSFEESESDYKYLKALIEGGLETMPENILVYATSNRRHLIRETWNERTDKTADEDMYHSDTVREKLSLADRFGITIGYYRPSFNQYTDMAVEIAKRYPEIKLTPDQIRKEAKVWIRTHGNPSGRTAEQLVIHLLAKEE